MREFQACAEGHVHEVRDVWQHDAVFVNGYRTQFNSEKYSFAEKIGMPK
jgi:hypothetical protein